MKDSLYSTEAENEELRQANIDLAVRIEYLEQLCDELFQALVACEIVLRETQGTWTTVVSRNKFMRAARRALSAIARAQVITLQDC